MTRAWQRGIEPESLASRGYRTTLKYSRELFKITKALQPICSFTIFCRKKWGFSAENSGFTLTHSDNFALLLPDKAAIHKNCHQRRGDTHNE
jgi:hypothetical protein